MKNFGLAFLIFTLIAAGCASINPANIARGSKGILEKDTLAMGFTECVKGTGLEAVVAKPYNRLIDSSRLLKGLEFDATLVDELKRIGRDARDEVLQVEADWLFIEEKLAESDVECTQDVYRIAGDLKAGYVELKTAYLANEKLVTVAEWGSLILRATTNPQGVIVEKLLEAAA